jgi:glycine dehydrogenase subunit 2
MSTIQESRERVIFEKGMPGRRGYSLPASDVPAADLQGALPDGLLRGAIEGFPEVAENDLVRHYLRLSTWNYSVDSGMYPLGSCTMKCRR